ncbi:hypothetical protein EJ04DRAFT_489965 [Polyplosphaeria fusca]|uniref:Uncharacterized protein n=1 Tax=Polyplosphaeria fusca TaxID=682080 RepID=A0A9P4R445_9PLEO|nr:hypothetical protein EJ04DRAFT_489965 [Polyplosphaeria fusca]
MAYTKLHLAIPDQRVARSFVQTVCIFEFPDPSCIDEAFEALQGGLLDVLAAFPFLAGALGPEDENGELKLEYPVEVTQAHVQAIMTREILTDEKYAYATLAKNNMPTSTFVGQVFAPRSLREHPDIPDDVEGIISFKDVIVPPLGIGAIFIPGGLCISTYTHHSVMDGTGRSNFLRQFAQSVSKIAKPDKADNVDKVDSPLTPCMSSEARMGLDKLIPLHSPGQTPPTAEVYGDGTLEYKKTLAENTPCSGKIFTIEADKIRSYRDALVAGGVKTERQISIFSILAALVWIHVTRARYPHLEDYRDGDTSIAIAVDLRKRMVDPIGEGYVGNLALGTKATMSIPFITAEEIVTEKTIIAAIQAIAHSIAKIDEAWIDRHLRFLRPRGPITDTELHMKHRFGPDLYMTSWMNQQVYEEWNIPGAGTSRPTYFRRAHSEIDGGIVFMPRRGVNGPYEILVRIAQQDMDALVAEERGLASWCATAPT